MDAIRDRDIALADRGASAEGRAQSTLDRTQAHLDRTASAHDRRATSYDALTGSYLLDPGLQALQVKLDKARRDSQGMSVAHVVASEPNDTTTSQLDQDAMMIVFANALGSCLREQDLLIRYATTQYLCAMSDLDKDEAPRLLEPVHEALAGPPSYGLASIGYAASRENDTIDTLVTRARTDHRNAPS